MSATMSTAAPTESTTDPVTKSVVVKTSVEQAFQLFTDGFDSWWPRSHHIGKSPMTRTLIEGRVGGRCYSEQEDGTECDWGSILEWEPPHRFVMAWQITHEWGYEPDLSRSSEVEVRFSPAGEGMTRVDLEHRHFERHGDGGASIRTAVNSEGGWGVLLQMYADRAGSAAEDAK
jgi:uncharacterized protein YndB with AHSA1/START domain